MDNILLAVLFAAALWLGDAYNMSKFRHFYPKLKPDILPNSAPRWKQVFVYRNQTLKNVGLFAMWAGFTLGFNASKGFYALGFLGLAIYIFSRLWPTVLAKGPMSNKEPHIPDY